jgi:hypothetical protein
MNLSKIILLNLLVLQILFQAQSIKAQDVGTVNITITSNTFILNAEMEKEMVRIPPVSNDPPYKVMLKGNNFLKEIPLQDRRKRLNNYNKEYFIDEYEIEVPVGFYVIEVKGVETYQFPKFLVDKNETVRFEVPERKFMESLCGETIRLIDTEINGEKISSLTNSNGKSSYKLLQTDVLSLVEPFQMIVSYCEKETNGQIIKYKNAEFRYKNFTILSNQLIVDKSLLTVTAFEIREISSVFQQFPNKMGNLSEIKIDLRQK